HIGMEHMFRQSRTSIAGWRKHLRDGRLRLSSVLRVPITAVQFHSTPWSRFIWYLICVVCLCVMTKLSWDLSGGKTAAESAKSPTRENAVFLLGCAVAIRFAFNAISHLQTDLLLDALLLLGLLALVQSRFALAGSYWGLS